jgi:hypothetical protein
MTPTCRALDAVLGGRVDHVPPANPLAQTTNDHMRFAIETERSELSEYIGRSRAKDQEMRVEIGDITYAEWSVRKVAETVLSVSRRGRPSQRLVDRPDGLSELRLPSKLFLMRGPASK